MILVLQSAEVEAMVRGLAKEGPAEAVEVDITDMRAVRAVVEARRPQAVVLAAWRDAESAEADPDRAFRVSAEAAINLAAASLEFDCRPVYLSVADVFGQVGGPFDVSESPEPSAIFAEAALRGERFLQTASRGRGLVVRSGPWVEAVEAQLRAGLRAPTRSKVSPVRADDLGEALRGWCVEPGLVHAASEGPSVDVAALYRTVGGWHGLPVRVSASESALALTPRLAPSKSMLPAWDRDEDRPTEASSSAASTPALVGPKAPSSQSEALEALGVHSEPRSLSPGEAWALPGPGQLWVLAGKVLVEGGVDCILAEGQGGAFRAGTVRPVTQSRVLFIRPGSSTP
ncbi:MAG: sugar nucleotide-binding protein [Myxococcota bacterium]